MTFEGTHHSAALAGRPFKSEKDLQVTLLARRD